MVVSGLFFAALARARARALWAKPFIGTDCGCVCASSNAVEREMAAQQDEGTTTHKVSPVIAALIVFLIFAIPGAMYVGLNELIKLVVPDKVLMHDEL